MMIRQIEMARQIDGQENLEVLRLCKCGLPPPPPERDWISKLRNLRVLVLDGVDSIREDHCRSLQKIPNLKMLRLANNETCVELPQEFGQPNAFSRLKKLEIDSFTALKCFPFRPYKIRQSQS